MSFLKKLVKVATGGLVDLDKKRKRREAERAFQREMKRQDQIHSQNQNRLHKEMADQSMLENELENEGGMLADEDGLVVGMPLSKKKKLGA